MKKARGIACALCLAALALLLPLARRALPVDTRPLVAEKYAGWSGVLRLWVCEGWTPGSGSLSGWLNACAARFERAHPGVYVQPIVVDADALASMSDSGIARPDLILFPPGLLDGPTGLTPLEAPGNLREALADAGRWGGATYAVPVALGGYLWAWDAARLDALPDMWADGGLAVPAPEPWRRWDAALLALCAGLRGGEAEAPAPELPGLDLGLAAAATADRSRRLPEGFDWDADAYRHFTNGEAAATLVTQREVRRLESLSGQGRGPDWRLSPGGAFTDQLLYLAIPERPEGDPRPSLCAALVDWLLSEDCQGTLARAGAFAVTDAPSGYAPGDALLALDAALREDALIVPNAFDRTWPSDAEAIVRKFADGTADAASLWPALAARLKQNPNVP